MAWVWARIAFPESTLSFGVALILVLVVGAFLTARVKGNLLGPLLVFGASAGLVYDVGTAYGGLSLSNATPLPLDHFAAWLGTWTGPIGFLTVSVLFVLFPEGRFLGRRGWFIPLLSLPVVLAAIGAAQLWELSTADLVRVSSIGEPSEVFPEYAMVNAAFILSFGPLMLVSALSLFARYWRGASVERLQIKWLAASSIFAPVFIFTSSKVFPSLPETVVATLGLATLPLAIAVAITRYRLYDLGRLVSRTVTYALVAGLLIVVFAAGALWVPQALGIENPLFVAATTLVVAAAFTPMRRQMQGWVGRWFNRSHYDAERVMDGFAGSLRDRMDGEDVVAGWVGVVSETMQPSTLGVWVRK